MPPKSPRDFSLGQLHGEMEEKLLVKTDEHGFDVDKVKRTRSLKIRDIKTANVPATRPKSRRTQSTVFGQNLGIINPMDEEYLNEISSTKCSWQIVHSQSDRLRFVI